MIKVDFSAATPPHDGWYTGRITDVIEQEIGSPGLDGQVKKFKPEEKGYHSVTATVTIEGGEHAEKEITGWFKTTPKRIWQILELYKATGVPWEGKTQIDPKRDLSGKRLKFYCETTPSDDGSRPFVTINGVLPLTAATPNTNGTAPAAEAAKTGERVARE